jgi:hypothetical protein
MRYPQKRFQWYELTTQIWVDFCVRKFHISLSTFVNISHIFEISGFLSTCDLHNNWKDGMSQLKGPSETPASGAYLVATQQHQRSLNIRRYKPVQRTNVWTSDIWPRWNLSCRFEHHLAAAISHIYNQTWRHCVYYHFWLSYSSHKSHTLMQQRVQPNSYSL